MKARFFLMAMLCVAMALHLCGAETGTATAASAVAEESAARPPMPPPPPPDGGEQDGGGGPRGDGGENHGRRPPRQGEMLPHFVRRYFERLAQENPQEFQRLMQLRMTNQEEFLKEVRKSIPAPEHEQQRRQFQVERECFQLAAQLREAKDDAEKERLSKELDARAQESLDLVLQRAEAQLTEMQKYIERLRNDRERLLKARREFYLKAKPPVPPANKQEPPPPPPADGGKESPPPPPPPPPADGGAEAGAPER